MSLETVCLPGPRKGSPARRGNRWPGRPDEQPALQTFPSEPARFSRCLKVLFRIHNRFWN